MGDVEAALDDYKQGKYNLGFNQGKFDLYIGMKLGQHYSGVILYNQKRYLEADALLSDALLRKEGYWSVKAQKIFFDRAMTRHRLKMYEEAIEDYTSAIAIEPANPFFYLGRYYSKLLNKGSGENGDETDLAKYKELMKS
jgi:tetratricopeptide (TPR) repeat protein